LSKKLRVEKNSPPPSFIGKNRGRHELNRVLRAKLVGDKGVDGERMPAEKSLRKYDRRNIPCLKESLEDC